MVEDIIMSIKPKYADMIFSGKKKVEFRKINIKNIDNDGWIYIYASSPIKQIIGRFKIKEIYISDIDNLWDWYSPAEKGIKIDEFYNYFKNKTTGYGFRLKEIQKFEKAIDPYKYILNFKPPQSFKYINTHQSEYWDFYNKVRNTRYKGII
jgi:predicted transcriptional regulator